ncbi:uncharacterized protein K489DRAFT_20718 [Dissoconium aciculare CBS 342.82]|uniref:Uncharacterized protein n=1 Tax=Dissoconium aciculare CBS 342.82 TaxID=1314786 RepID=A0A6J3MIM8_9PEZI|nr:uncharacterized protein K489DRAFT_20718 [Dissoconium aciculare CBS 342.82]KAF1827559.1 hypothetical protein K489DRAFT_20718 [Dissoconium aciculare CBS 342.82]
MTFIERWWLLSPALPFLSPPACWYAVETFVPPEVVAPPGSDWINIGISFVCLVITCTSRHSSYLHQISLLANLLSHARTLCLDSVCCRICPAYVEQPKWPLRFIYHELSYMAISMIQ